MQYQEGTELSQVLSVLPLHLQEMLCRVNEKTADALSEIRLRSGRPIVLVTPQNTYFLTKTGKTTCICSDADNFGIRDFGYCSTRLRVFGAQPSGRTEKRLPDTAGRSSYRRLRYRRAAKRLCCGDSQSDCTEYSHCKKNPRCSARSIEHLFSSRFAKHPFSRSADEWEDNRSARSGNPNLAGLFGQALYLRRDRCAL